MKMLSAFASAIASATLLMCSASAQDLPALGPDDLLFSVENMDPGANPAKDFYRFAAGGWLDRVERPQDRASYSFVDIQLKRIKAQTLALLDRTAGEAPTAPKGSVTQLVGDFYSAYMDTARRNTAGMAPLKDELEAISAISSLDDLIRYAAHFETDIGGPLLLGFGPFPDLADGTRYAILATGGATGLETERDVYTSGEDAPRRKAYRAYVEELLKIAGYEPDAATRMTNTVLEIETELDAAKLADEEKRDARNIYNVRSLDDVQTQIPNLDLTLFFSEAGLDVPERVILIEPRYFPALSRMLNERPLDDFKDYAAFLLIHSFAKVLSTEFDEPARVLRQAFQGVAELDPIEDRALGLLVNNLGHPVSRLYVEATFRQETRAELLAMIDDILAEFRKRIPTRDWLSPATKTEALAKLDALSVAVGYPDDKDWVDYSSLTIVPDDPVANLMALSRFGWNRALSQLGGSVVRDKFFGKSTYPIALNAAYSFGINGFEITAAIAQPPAYEPTASPAIRYCRFGAVIGHEATHGFDSSGRQYDADGNLRNWWTDDDAKAFLAEAKKLVDQANETEIVAGYHGRGEYWLPEDMADVGGITLAHAALMNYLARHPEEDVEVGGFTQEQLCFIGWAQLWAEKATDAYLINVATAENHPPNTYRTTAPLKHVDAFYEAFGIKEGDPMWLPPKKRARTW